MRTGTRSIPGRRMLSALAAASFGLALFAGAAGVQDDTRGAGDLVEPPVPSERVFPLAERSRPFKVIEGERKGEVLTMSLSRADRGEAGRWVLELEGQNRVFLRRNDAGAIVIERIELLDQNKAVEYDPPVRLLPDRLRPGEEYSTESRAVIYNLETGERTREGRATHRARRVATATFDTPAGKMRGYLVGLVHEIDLDLANLRIVLQSGYTDEHALVYRRIESTVEKLGLFDETSVTTAALAETQSGVASGDAASEGAPGDGGR